LVDDARRSLTQIVAAPVLGGVVVPVLLVLVDPWRRATEWPSLIIGAVVGVAGVAMLLRAGRDLVAAWPDQLPVTGLHANSRNPMPLAVLAILAGLSMASRSPILGVYLISAVVGLHLWVVRVAEPRAEQRFGERWHQYRQAVPRWFPRLS
jgi:protein-S-isoprenylcysteine O-methyltransferase Ste14